MMLKKKYKKGKFSIQMEKYRNFKRGINVNNNRLFTKIEYTSIQLSSNLTEKKSN